MKTKDKKKERKKKEGKSERKEGRWRDGEGGREEWKKIKQGKKILEEWRKKLSSFITLWIPNLIRKHTIWLERGEGACHGLRVEE